MKTQFVCPIISKQVSTPFFDSKCDRVKEIIKTPNTKEVVVKSDNRYTTIEINESFKSNPLGNENNTHTRTSIIKDNTLNTKQVHIRKIFSSLDSNNSHYIVRDIFIEHINNKKYKSDKSIRLCLSRDENLKSFLNLTKDNFFLPFRDN